MLYLYVLLKLFFQVTGKILSKLHNIFIVLIVRRFIHIDQNKNENFLCNLIINTLGSCLPRVISLLKKIARYEW